MVDGERVFLVRHGVAEDDHPAGDAARPLTAKGRRRFRKHARRLGPELGVSHIVTSPLVRAVQTAELLALGNGIEEVSVHAALIPGPETGRKLAGLVARAGAGTAFVGHEPSLSEAAASLLGLSAGLPFPFKKGGVLVLQREGKRFRFEAFLAPRQEPLRTL